MTLQKSIKKEKTIGILVVYLIAAVTVWACQEEEEPTPRDPSVSIFFFNKDSLDQVSAIVDSLDAELVGYDTTIANLKSNADILADSLIAITDSIANGGSLEEERAQVINDLDTLNQYLSGIESEDSTVNVRQTEWTGVATTINSGLVFVDKIENIKNDLSVFFEDSSTTWNLPLDMNANDIDLNITIADEVYRLSMSYERFTIADEKNKVTVRTKNFEIITSDFDHSEVSCVNCEDSETTIYVEF